MKGEINYFVLCRGAQRCFWVLVVLWDPQGPPRDPARGGARGPERVSEKLNDIRHVGYQFSQFSALSHLYDPTWRPPVSPVMPEEVPLGLLR